MKRDLSTLMPGSAPPPEIGAPPGGTGSSDARAARAARVRDARELARMQDELSALARDIRVARRTARRVAAAPPLELPSRHHRGAPPRGERVRLPDGAEIIVRAIGPDDVDQLRAGFRHLSAVSRYRRFLASVDDLTPAQLASLTHVDHVAHEAIGAIDPATGEGIGIARYVRDPEAPQQAEVAVVVADRWQHRGVASALIERLAARARAAGIDTVTATMLVGDEAARRLIARFADAHAEHRDAGTISLAARLKHGDTR
jgi:GNAT superfamily N-acetyltransferase